MCIYAHCTNAGPSIQVPNGPHLRVYGEGKRHLSNKLENTENQ